MKKYFLHWKFYLGILLSVLIAPDLVRAGETVSTGDASPSVAEIFIDLEIDPPLAIPSAWSMFWKKELQNMILLATLDPIDDATKRVKYAEENMQLARFVMIEPNDADQIAIAIRAIIRGEDLIKVLDARKQRYLLNGNPDSRKLAQNISVLLNHSDLVLAGMISLVGRDNLLAEGAIGQDFQTAFGSLHGAVVLFRQQQTQAEREADNRLRGTGAFRNDQDRDGLLDALEIEMGLSIHDPDTDGDGLDEKREIEVYGTDPTKFDTDGDGFRDGMEVINGYNPLGAGKIEIVDPGKRTANFQQRRSSSEGFFTRVQTGRTISTATREYITKVDADYAKLTQ